MTCSVACIKSIHIDGGEQENDYDGGGDGESFL